MNLRPRIICTFLLALLVLLAAPLAPRARAAQEAEVTVEQAAIRERPTLDAKIIESKPTGAKIRISSYSKDGWYKVKTSIGQYGWIWQGDIALQTFSDDVKASNLDLPERAHDRRSGNHVPWFFLTAGGGLSPLISQIEDTQGHLHISPQGFFDVGVRVSDITRLNLRLLSWSDAISIRFNNPDTDVSPGGTALMFGIRNDLNQGEVNDFAVALYGGINLTTGMSVTTAANSAVVTTTNIDLPGYAFLLDLAYTHYFTHWFAVVGEGGFFWDYIPQGALVGLGSNHYNTYGPWLSVAAQFTPW